MPKHAGARSVYVKGAFVDVLNEQFNTFDVCRAMHHNIIPILKTTRCTSVSNLFILE